MAPAREAGDVALVYELLVPLRLSVKAEGQAAPIKRPLDTAWLYVDSKDSLQIRQVNASFDAFAGSTELEFTSNVDMKFTVQEVTVTNKAGGNWHAIIGPEYHQSGVSVCDVTASVDHLDMRAFVVEAPQTILKFVKATVRVIPEPALFKQETMASSKAFLSAREILGRWHLNYACMDKLRFKGLERIAGAIDNRFNTGLEHYNYEELRLESNADGDLFNHLYAPRQVYPYQLQRAACFIQAYDGIQTRSYAPEFGHAAEYGFGTIYPDLKRPQRPLTRLLEAYLLPVPARDQGSRPTTRVPMPPDEDMDEPPMGIAYEVPPLYQYLKDQMKQPFDRRSTWVRPFLDMVARVPCHVVDVYDVASGHMHTCWFAHTRDMCLLRYEEHDMNTVYTRVEAHDLARMKTKNRLWYPSLIFRQSYGPQDQLTLSQLEVFELTPDYTSTQLSADHSIGFPPNTVVTDEERHVTYRVDDSAPEGKVPLPFSRAALQRSLQSCLISEHWSGERLKYILSDLKEMTGIGCVVHCHDLPDVSLSLEVIEERLPAVLETLLTPLGLDHYMQNGAIHIVRQQDEQDDHLTEPTPSSDCQDRFNQVYQLQDGEVLTFIKAPYIPERKAFLASLDKPEDQRYLFSWNGDLGRNISVPPPTLFHFVWALCRSSKMPIDIRDIDRRMIAGNFMLPIGDWILREDTSFSERLAALESILAKEAACKLRFTKKTIEQEAIVVRGRFELKPRFTMDTDRTVYFYYDDDLHTQKVRRYNRGINSIERLSNTLEGLTLMRVLNQTEPCDVKVQYAIQDSAKLRKYSSVPIDRERLDTLLSNLAQQTNLEFTIEKHPRDM